MIGTWIMCWQRLRNVGHLTVSPFLCLSEVEILVFDIAFLLGIFSCVSHFQCYFTQGKSREEILYASEALSEVNLLQATPQPNISILAVVCHCPIRDKPCSHGLLAHLCLSWHSSELWLQSQICLVSPACWSYLLPHLTSGSCQNSSTQIFCSATSGAEQEGSGSMAWSHWCLMSSLMCVTSVSLIRRDEKYRQVRKENRERGSYKKKSVLFIVFNLVFLYSFMWKTVKNYLEEKALLQLSKSGLFMCNCQGKCNGGLKPMHFT